MFQVSTTNAAPVVANALRDFKAKADQLFNYSFPEDTFSDADPGEVLTYSATRGDGSALPSWLTFDPETRTFSGTPTASDVGTLAVKVTASDLIDEVSDTFDIEVEAACADDLTGRTEIWSGSVVVEGVSVIPGADPSYYGYHQGNSYGDLSDKDFDFDSITYTMIDIYVGITGITGDVFIFHEAAPGFQERDYPALRLHVCGDTFEIDERGSNRAWQNSGLDWSEYASVKLVLSASTDATLKDLSLADQDGNALPLNQAFDPAGTSFSAIATADVTHATLTPTVNEKGALVKYLDSTDSELDDADDLADGFQRSLSVDKATVTKIQVTPGDRGDPTTYTTTIYRPVSLRETTLVSNLGQGDSDELEAVHAQPFTTGSDENGYLLTGVKVESFIGSASAVVRIVPSKTDGTPDLSNSATFVRLTAPPTITSRGVNTYTAPANTMLAPDTTYHVLVSAESITVVAPGALQLTDSDAEDAGAAAGWTIGNSRYYRATGATAFTEDTTHLVKLAISGHLGTNKAPVVANAIDHQRALVDADFDFTFPADTFTDADGDELTYEATLNDGNPLPTWLTFDAANRNFSGTPATTDVGQLSVKVTASDGTDSVSDVFLIVVSTGIVLVSNLEQADGSSSSNVQSQPFTTGSNANGYVITGVQIEKASGAGNFAVRIVPSLTGGGPDFSDDTKFILLTAPATITENAVNTFTAPANTILLPDTTYHVLLSGANSLTAAPGSMRLTSSDAEDSSGQSDWTIGNERYNSTNGTIFNTHSESIKIAIIGILSTTPLNRAPVVANDIENKVATVGVEFDFTFPANTFTDADGDTLEYSATRGDDTPLPSWLEFDAATRTFSGTPAASDVGTVSVKVTASDGSLSVSDVFDIVVSTDITLVSNTRARGWCW